MEETEHNTIQWVIDAFNDKVESNKRGERGKHGNQYIKESRRLKMCPNCNNVWETSFSGLCNRYNHMPTYGLKRALCTLCKKIV